MLKKKLIYAGLGGLPCLLSYQIVISKLFATYQPKVLLFIFEDPYADALPKTSVLFGNIANDVINSILQEDLIQISMTNIRIFYVTRHWRNGSLKFLEWNFETFSLLSGRNHVRPFSNQLFDRLQSIRSKHTKSSTFLATKDLVEIDDIECGKLRALFSIEEN